MALDNSCRVFSVLHDVCWYARQGTTSHGTLGPPAPNTTMARLCRRSLLRFQALNRVSNSQVRGYKCECETKIMHKTVKYSTYSLSASFYSLPSLLIFTLGLCYLTSSSYLSRARALFFFLSVVVVELEMLRARLYPSSSSSSTLPLGTLNTHFVLFTSFPLADKQKQHWLLYLSRRCNVKYNTHVTLCYIVVEFVVAYWKIETNPVV